MESKTYERDNSLSLFEQIGIIRRNIQLGKELYPIEIINTVDDQLPLYYETENGYFEQWTYDGAGNPIGYIDASSDMTPDEEFMEECNDIVNEHFWELIDTDKKVCKSITEVEPRLNLIDETIGVQEPLPEIKVYLIDQTKPGCEICISLIDEDFISIATVQKNVYTLNEFQRAVNNYTITDLNDYVMRIL